MLIEQCYASFMNAGDHSHASDSVAGRVQSDDYLFVPGDIIAVNPGTDNGIPSGDKLWLLQVNKPHPLTKNRPGCRIFGFWLDEKENEDDSIPGRHFALLSTPVKVHYGSIIKDDNAPLVIPVEELNSGWQSGHVMYAFTDEYCLWLDEMSDAYQRHLTGLTEETSDDEHEQQTEVHEVEHTAMQHRRVVRNAEGQTLTSYRDLTNPRSTRQRQRRVQNLGQEESESQAGRNSPEFEHSETD